ncbi:hypothetical protein M378DRAFT_358522 [Amanita muscaria Koide BX008]|uniref:DUF6533 domain-containing protein n=1 Tax=Amanita muscaria (strain Koide BX008) TaxID=946122 RepID=A0A0C2SV07_AMAMK|nr:hypothetical protein M378DRAFT_358522 [Amanita muscaria Koide BX008]
MSIDTEALIQARWERNAYLSCSVLIVYEYFLHFGAEVEYFWKQRWSLAKCLFLWSRYYSVAYNISNAVVFMQPRPSFDVSNTFFHWQNTGAALQTITTHVLLELRLWAMYGSTRKVLLLFALLTIGEALSMGLVLGIPNPNLIGTNEPFPGVFICADSDPNNGSHWVVYYWVAICAIELILLSLALRKAWEHREASGSIIMKRLTAESAIYFIAYVRYSVTGPFRLMFCRIFWIYIANMILWIINRITLDEFGTAFSFVLPSIFANRLLISARSAAHGADDKYIGETGNHVPIRFLRRGCRGRESTVNNTVLLESRTEGRR